VHPAGVGVAPHPLQVAVTVERPCAGVLEQQVDRFDRAFGADDLVTADLEPRMQRDGHAFGDVVLQRPDVVGQQCPGRVDLRGCSGDPDLRERVAVAALTDERCPDPLGLQLHVGLVRAVRHADDGRGDGRGEQRMERQAVERTGVDGLARPLAAAGLGHGEGEVGRHERPVDLDVM
jgi:hypothetical protein